MLEQTQYRCKMIRNRHYPKDQWPGELHARAVQDAGGGNRVLVELGCGRDAESLRAASPHYRMSIGLDMEISRQGEPSANWRVVQADVHRLPLSSNIADAISMEHVVEHLSDPVEMFTECVRVLRPGGRLIITTVNVRFPPIAMVRMLPHRIRRLLNRIASGTQPEDTFPVHYRANTVSSLTSAARLAGLEPLDVRLVTTHPIYFMFNVPLYRAAVWLERRLSRVEGLAGLRHFILAIYELPARKATTDAASIPALIRSREPEHV